MLNQALENHGMKISMIPQDQRSLENCMRQNVTTGMRLPEVLFRPSEFYEFPSSAKLSYI